VLILLAQKSPCNHQTWVNHSERVFGAPWT
jgi:hypothetical protein